MKYARILAVADIHSPQYLYMFVASISKLSSINNRIDLVILAGDIVDRGNVSAMRPVLDALKKITQHYEAPLVAVFGNEEYFAYEAEFLKRYPEVIWLNDDYRIVTLQNGMELCIVGSRGVLNRPTAWQSRHIPNIYRIYRERIKKLRELLKSCREHGTTLLVTHYAPTYATVYGEPHTIYSFLGYQLLETLNSNECPHIAIHGHAHNAKVLQAIVNGVNVYNVALPARRDVTVIELAVKSS